MTTDLSHSHHPVSNLFPPVTPAECAKHTLSADQLADFTRNGFVAGMQMLDEPQMAALRAELAELVHPEHDGRDLWYEYHTNESTDADTILFHALGAWRLRPALHDILWNPAVLAPAAQLLAGPVRFWHDQLFCKPAKHGGVVAWHQDYSYWTRTKPMAHLTCWIGLDDSTIENGCVHYVPGSHRWPLLPMTALAGGMESIKEVLTPEQRDEFTPVACELKAGQAVFHHPLTLHGSFANSSPRPRRAVVLNFFRDGTLSDADEPLLEGVDTIPRGEKMQGRFFPLLYEG